VLSRSHSCCNKWGGFELCIKWFNICVSSGHKSGRTSRTSYSPKPLISIKFCIWHEEKCVRSSRQFSLYLVQQFLLYNESHRVAFRIQNRSLYEQLAQAIKYTGSYKKSSMYAGQDNRKKFSPDYPIFGYLTCRII
jgi:hypothetical protein